MLISGLIYTQKNDTFHSCVLDCEFWPSPIIITSCLFSLVYHETNAPKSYVRVDSGINTNHTMMSCVYLSNIIGFPYKSALLFSPSVIKVSDTWISQLSQALTQMRDECLKRQKKAINMADNNSASQGVSLKELGFSSEIIQIINRKYIIYIV